MCGSLEVEGVTVAGKGTPSPHPPLSSSELKIIFNKITKSNCFNNDIYWNCKLYLLKLASKCTIFALNPKFLHMTQFFSTGIVCGAYGKYRVCLLYLYLYLFTFWYYYLHFCWDKQSHEPNLFKMVGGGAFPLPPSKSFSFLSHFANILLEMIFSRVCPREAFT